MLRASIVAAGCLLAAGCFLAAGCRKETSPSPSPDAAPSPRPGAGGAPATAGASAAAAPSAPPAGASASAGGEATKAPLTPEEKRALARYAAAIGEGRKATRERRYDDAGAAFGRALEQRPNDARALAERGYARLLAGELEGAGQDFDRALAGGVEPKLASQAFFNVGLLREKKAEAEAARAAFAIANALSPSAAAKAKLAGRSACTADVRVAPDSEALESAKDFDELATVIGPAKDLGTPKASVCIRTHTAYGTPDDRDVCDGPPPWKLHHHHLHFTEDLILVAPKKGGGLLYLRDRVGSWPARCTNLPWHDAEIVGGVLHVTSTFDGSMAALDESAPASDDWQMPCVDVVGYESHEFYDLTTGKSLLRVYLPAGVPKPTLSLAGAKVTLAGASCDQAIDLAATRGR